MIPPSQLIGNYDKIDVVLFLGLNWILIQRSGVFGRTS